MTNRRRLMRKLKRMATQRLPQAFSLAQLGAAYGTDKVDEFHRFGGRTNCDVYDTYMSRWRRDRFGLLEIGILTSASLRMWRSYFPRATVVGLDIDPAAVERAASIGFATVLGSQADPDALDRALAIAGDLRVVIDDGSHVNELTAASLAYLFPRLSSGALYVIEDTLCTYEPALRTWPGMQHNAEGLDLDNDRADIDALLMSLTKDCDLGIPAFPGIDGRTVAFVHVWPGLVVVGRA